jgi:hypothetical protein
MTTVMGLRRGTMPKLYWNTKVAFYIPSLVGYMLALKLKVT